MKIDVNIDISPTVKYDDSLFEVYVLDYGDNYHKLPNEPSSELEKEVRKIRARYRSLTKYNDAMIIYREWMDYLEMKHGGKQLLKKKIEAEAIDDYVPRKPKLKGNRTIKYLYKNNIVVSDVNEREIDMDKLDEFLNEIYSENNTAITNTFVNDKVANELAEKVGNVGRRINVIDYNNDIMHLNEYFKSKNIKSKKGKKKKNNKNVKKKLTNDVPFRLTDVMNGKYDYENIEDSETANTMNYNGLILNSGNTKNMELYTLVNNSGWNSYKLMKRAKYSKRIASRFKPQKKGKKKKNKNFDIQDSYDDLLIDIITDQGYNSYEEFEKDMLNMTSENIFK